MSNPYLPDLSKWTLARIGQVIPSGTVYIFADKYNPGDFSAPQVIGNDIYIVPGMASLFFTEVALTTPTPAYMMMP